MSRLIVKRIMDPERWKYIVSGLPRRIIQEKVCPSCGGKSAGTVDRSRVFYSLERCGNCELLFRFPYESASEMADFYESGYDEPGLTTDLPSPTELESYLSTNFAGTEKDFSHVIEKLKLLGVPARARILDYGANWGYCTYQFRRAGYEAEGYEISTNRGRFGENLGVEIKRSIELFTEPFDVVFSSHVLEHTPDPKAALLEQYSVLHPGGMVIAYLPSGADQLRQKNYPLFHTRWGRVHPVLINERFVQKVFPSSPTLFASGGERAPFEDWALDSWDQESSAVRNLSGGELFFVVKKPQ